MADSTNPQVALTPTVARDTDTASPESDDTRLAGDKESTTATPGEGTQDNDIEKTEIIHHSPVKKPALEGGAHPNPGERPLPHSNIEEPSKSEDEATPEVNRVSLDSSLEDELFECRLLNLPGLIEHLFPDSLLPIPFESLKILAMGRHWDKTANRWKDPDPASSTFFNVLSCTLIAASMTHPTFELPSQRVWLSECYMPSRGAPTNTRRRAALNLVDVKKAESIGATWTSTLVTIERKNKASEAPEALIQLTNSARMIFGHQEERRFHIGISICHMEVRVYVFDRAGIVGSVPFHLRNDPDLLIRLVAGLVLTDNSAIGLDASILRDERNQRFVSVSGHLYQLVKTIVVSDDLCGRSTVIWQARRGGDDFVIKDTWNEPSRYENEAELLRAVEGVDGISQLVDEEVVKLPDGRDDNTDHLRSFIAHVPEYKHKEWYKRLEVRVHNRIVITPFAQPLKLFRSKRELLTVLIDAIEVHRRLVEKNIMHCDISINNVMIYRPKLPLFVHEYIPTTDADSSVSTTSPNPTPLPRVKGILIDLDNAVITHDDKGKHTDAALESAKFCTGTIPYAAAEILMGLPSGEIRQAHHDLESFFYILLWISLRFAGPGGLKRRDIDMEKEGQMRHWIEGGNRGDVRELGEAKYTTMTTTRAHFRRVVTGRCAPYFRDLVPCIEELRLLFFPKELGDGGGGGDDEGDHVREGLPGDVRPRVTHQQMIDILRKPLEWLPEIDDLSPQADKEVLVMVPLSTIKRKTDDEEDEGKEEEDAPEKSLVMVPLSTMKRKAEDEEDEDKREKDGPPSAKRARLEIVAT